jgi:hypothetical protein
MIFAVTNTTTKMLTKDVFSGLPDEVRKQIGLTVAAVVDADLTTVVRPFMFGGKVVHELYFDPAKLGLYNENERAGAALTAFIICWLAHRTAKFPLTDQALRTHHKRILGQARRWKCFGTVNAFLRKFSRLEDEWQRESSP